jgi:Fe2+ or Zn2+ uptake regulation protein
MNRDIRSELIPILKENGFKATPGRLALLEILKESPKPISAEGIMKKMKSKLDLATIYRALKEFEKSKMVARLNLSADYSAYEFLVGRSHHHHLVCCDCKTT